MSADWQQSIEQGIYLGMVDNVDYNERYAVVGSVRFTRPLVLLSPELSLIEKGTVVYDKDNPTKVGTETSGVDEYFKVGIAKDLKPNDDIYFCLFASYDCEPIGQGQERRANFAISDSPAVFKDTAVYNPLELRNKATSATLVKARGQVVSENDGEFIIDAGIPVCCRKRRGVNIGDWVTTAPDQIYFLGSFRDWQPS